VGRIETLDWHALPIVGFGLMIVFVIFVAPKIRKGVGEYWK